MTDGQMFEEYNQIVPEEKWAELIKDESKIMTDNNDIIESTEEAVVSDDTTVTQPKEGDDSQDSDLNLVDFPLDLNEIPKALRRVASDLETAGVDAATKAVLVLLDDSNRIGVYGFGQCGGVHSVIGILDHAKMSMLAPRQPE